MHIIGFLRYQNQEKFAFLERIFREEFDSQIVRPNGLTQKNPGLFCEAIVAPKISIFVGFHEILILTPVIGLVFSGIIIDTQLMLLNGWVTSFEVIFSAHISSGPQKSPKSPPKESASHHDIAFRITTSTTHIVSARHRTLNLHARGKPSTMVSARRACRDGHLETKNFTKKCHHHTDQKYREINPRVVTRTAVAVENTYRVTPMINPIANPNPWLQT